LIMTRLETQVNNLVSFISSYGGKEPERAEEKPSKEA